MSLELINHLLNAHASEIKRGVSIPLDGLTGTTLDIVTKLNRLLDLFTRTKDRLKRDKVTLYSVLNTIPQGVFWKDLESNFLGCNQKFSDFVGLAKPIDIVGKTDYDITSPDRAKEYLNEDAKVINTVKSLYDIVYHSKPNGRWTVTHKIPLVIDDQIFGILGVTEDITAKKEAETKLVKSEAQFRLLAESISEVIWWLDSDLRLIYINPECFRLSGYTEEELLNTSLTSFFSKCCLQDFYKFIHEAQAGLKDVYTFDTKIRRKDNTLIWISCKIKALRDRGVFSGVIGILSDNTSQKQIEAELLLQASTDPLTGALNRRYLMDRACLLLTQDKSYWFLLLDIDHFKNINDIYGHPIGDQVLSTLTKVCKECLRDQDSFGRLGGEEFAIILQDVSRETAWAIAERIRNKLQYLDVFSFKFTVSIGLTQAIKGESCEDLFKRVDKALYSAKGQGRNNSVIL